MLHVEVALVGVVYAVVVWVCTCAFSSSVLWLRFVCVFLFAVDWGYVIVCVCVCGIVCVILLVCVAYLVWLSFFFVRACVCCGCCGVLCVFFFCFFGCVSVFLLLLFFFFFVFVYYFWRISVLFVCCGRCHGCVGMPCVRMSVL